MHIVDCHQYNGKFNEAWSIHKSTIIGMFRGTAVPLCNNCRTLQ